jgi:hypothetical protein
LRALISAAVLTIMLGSAAMADPSVAGSWHATLGSGVTMTMNVSPDGAWTSETRQNNKVVRQLRGEYKQILGDNDTGTLIFTPTKASAATGDVHTETDHYQLVRHGNQLKLTSDGDTMVFTRSPSQH